LASEKRQMTPAAGDTPGHLVVMPLRLARGLIFKCAISKIVPTDHHPDAPTYTAWSGASRSA
jgi:hypothetical protein